MKKCIFSSISLAFVLKNSVEFSHFSWLPPLHVADDQLYVMVRTTLHRWTETYVTVKLYKTTFNRNQKFCGHKNKAQDQANFKRGRSKSTTGGKSLVADRLEISALVNFRQFAPECRSPSTGGCLPDSGHSGCVSRRSATMVKVLSRATALLRDAF